MATALDIAKRNSNAAPVTVSDAARAAGLDTLAIEKKAELSVVPGMALGGTTLVGLTRDQLKDKLGEIGVPERERKMRAAQLWHWIYLRGAKDFTEMTNVGKGLRAALTRGLYARPPRGRLRAGVEGRHPQVADPHGADERPRQGRRDRVRLHSRNRSRHALRVEPGRLHADLLVLPYRHAAPRPQPDGGRNRRAA